MQHLETLWKVVQAAGSVRDIAQRKRNYHFAVQPPTTLYLHTQYSIVTIKRWYEPKIEISAKFQAEFGWKVLAEQDEAGIYLVAHRRAVVGAMSKAEFKIQLPHTTYLVLKLEESALLLDDITADLEIPPLIQGDTLYLTDTIRDK